MKIRNGFVSNSSSSSFCLYGLNLERVNIPEDKRDEIFENDPYAVFEEAGLEYHSYDGGRIVGLSPMDIEDNETGAQFKLRAANTLKEVLGVDVSKKCEWLQETYYS